MVLDMHCHTAEGSPDARISINDTIEKLKNKGYDGMIVTDHDSYNGYYSVDNNKKGDFVVLKGIEYDSLDAGHLLIILPHKVDNNVFEHRGLALDEIFKIVHLQGGIVGPAHPYDFSKLGVCNTKYKRDLDTLAKFDFIESFNGCLNLRGSILADNLARIIDKPCTGGSDSHSLHKVGLGKTILNEDIRSEDDLIDIIKSSGYGDTKATGRFFEPRFKPVDVVHSYGIVVGGFAYGTLNRCIGFNHKRKSELILNGLQFA